MRLGINDILYSTFVKKSILRSTLLIIGSVLQPFAKLKVVNRTYDTSQGRTTKEQSRQMQFRANLSKFVPYTQYTIPFIVPVMMSGDVVELDTRTPQGSTL